MSAVTPVSSWLPTNATRESEAFLFCLQPPTLASSDSASLLSVTFSQLVQNSLHLVQPMKTYCDTCAGFKLMSYEKSLQNLPPVLTFNTGADKMPMRTFLTQKFQAHSEAVDGKSPVGPIPIHPKLRQLPVSFFFFWGGGGG